MLRNRIVAIFTLDIACLRNTAYLYIMVQSVFRFASQQADRYAILVYVRPLNIYQPQLTSYFR